MKKFDPKKPPTDVVLDAKLWTYFVAAMMLYGWNHIQVFLN